MKTAQQLFGAAIAAMTLACSRDVAEVSTVPSVSLQAQANQIMYGDTLRLTLRVTNNTADEITYQTNSCNRHFEVVDAAGRIVGPSERVFCTAELVTATLPAGGSTTVNGFFTGLAPDLTLGPLPGPKTYLPEGNYTIRPALLLLPSGERLRGQSISVRLMRYLPD